MKGILKSEAVLQCFNMHTNYPYWFYCTISSRHWSVGKFVEISTFNLLIFQEGSRHYVGASTTFNVVEYERGFFVSASSVN